MCDTEADSRMSAIAVGIEDPAKDEGIQIADMGTVAVRLMSIPSATNDRWFSWDSL